tara:strand:- start:812 stop:2794 length:1983 start_codon:yes stop_codon:yes gene_type:complete
MPTNDKNTRNPAAPLFKRLTRMLSGPLVNHRAQAARQERRNDLDKYRYRFRSMSGQEFKRSDSNMSQNYNLFTSAAFRNQNRAERYVDFEQMEYMPEIASALDIYADEMTTSNEYGRLLNIACMNHELKTILESLFYDVLNIEFNCFGWARSMCKYGDFFLYMDVDEKMGVTSLIGMPNTEVERLEGQDPTNPNYVQYQWNGAGMTFENWQVAHFRILGNDKYSPYGTSVLDPARRIWRQLVLLEDAMIAYRVVRAPERRIFKIDVGNIPPQDVSQYMEKVKTEMKRNQLVNADTGRVDLRYNPLSLEEDYFIPMRGGVGSDITSLQGAASLNDIDDVKYMRDKLFSAIKIPQAYLTNLEGASEDKTTLAQKDIRFARTIQRLQRSILSEMEKIAVVHLYTLGYRGADLLSFKLTLNNPSRLAELQQLEYMRTKFETATAVPEGTYSKRWIASNILGLSDSEFLRNQRETFYDRKYQQDLEALAEVDALGGEGGMGGGGDLGDLGGDDLGGGDLGDLGGEDLGDLGGEGGEGEEAEPEALLATPPGRREDNPTKHEGAGHKPVESDKRQMGASGPRSRKLRSQAQGVETNTWRKNAGSGIGNPSTRNHKTDVRFGLEETSEATYTSDERILFENTTKVRMLVEQLRLEELKTEEADNDKT